jgi:hypothetical protein
MENTEPKLDPNFKFKVLKSDALTTIKISTAFYLNIKEALYFLVKDKSKKEVDDAIKQINEQKITEEWVYHYKTLFILSAEIEKKADEAGDMEEKTKEEVEEYLKKFAG